MENTAWLERYYGNKIEEFPVFCWVTMLFSGVNQMKLKEDFVSTGTSNAVIPAPEEEMVQTQSKSIRQDRHLALRWLNIAP